MNEVGITMLQNDLAGKLLPKSNHYIISRPTVQQLNDVKKHLKKFNIDISSNLQQSNIAKISNLQLPKLEGSDLNEHMWTIAMEQLRPYTNSLNCLLTSSDANLSIPTDWPNEAGWFRMNRTNRSQWDKIDRPLDKCLVFDVEVLTAYNLPLFAVALSSQNWFVWISSNLFHPDYSRFRSGGLQLDISDLIPIELKLDSERLIVGHNVSFDRSYIQEQYDRNRNSKLRFIDTMSMHIACSGFGSNQRQTYKFLLQNKKSPLKLSDQKSKQVFSTKMKWMNESTTNALSDVCRLYCPELPELDKEMRSIFTRFSTKDSINEVMETFKRKSSDLVNYCANDVLATYKLTQRLWPMFLERFPNPVTLAGTLEMSTMALPVDKDKWQQYIERSNKVCNDISYDLNKTLRRTADEACESDCSDLWLRNLNWSVNELRLNKKASRPETNEFVGDRPNIQSATTTKTDFVDKILRSAKNLPLRIPLRIGYPKWYVELCLKEHQVSIGRSSFNQTLECEYESPLHGCKLLTVKNQIAPSILRLTWGGYPMIRDKNLGWGFDKSQQVANVAKSFVYDNEDLMSCLSDVINLDIQQANMKTSNEDIPPFSHGPFRVDKCDNFYKINHPKAKMNANVGNPLSKDFHLHVKSGLMGSSGHGLFAILNSSEMVSYWLNNIARISSQFPLVYPGNDQAVIIPRTIVSGTVTRRAVERTWLTASNPSEKRIGSELKCMIQVPTDYRFVGADVDSQELWISCLFGDQKTRVQGSSACSWMSLRGTKQEGNDLHSHIASSIKITRDHAKILTYARIYGAGASFASRLLSSFDSSISFEEATKKVYKMYKNTKGIRKNGIWNGGSESEIFNSLEQIALSDIPCTPILGARMTRALEPRNVGEDYMTSRVNWAVQSSAVDYLHIMLVCMKWLDTRCLNRLAISIHDELRYITKTKHSLKTASNLQISNLLTRSFFIYQTFKQIDKLTGQVIIPEFICPPQSVSFFSSVEIDRCLRKDVYNDCITPSNPLGLKIGYGIEKGKSVTMEDLS